MDVNQRSLAEMLWLSPAPQPLSPHGVWPHGLLRQAGGTCAQVQRLGTSPCRWPPGSSGSRSEGTINMVARKLAPCRG